MNELHNECRHNFLLSNGGISDFILVKSFFVFSILTSERKRHTFIESLSMSFTSGNTGGKYKEKLTIDNLPSHDHTLRLMVNTYAQGGGTTNGAGIPYPSGNGAPNYVEHNGGDVPHNNLQPYISTNIWRRTA